MEEKNSKGGWRSFLELCLHMETTDRLEKLFDLFFTFEERKDLESRFLLVKALIKKNSSQREIAKDLGVSISKITRGSNALKILDDDFREFLTNKMI
jgi:TrpR family transcriptional regulator, trp operon repressor